MPDEIKINPIGIVSSELKQRYETPRQGVLAEGTSSVIKLFPYMNFEQALTGIDGFERLWIIYLFHLNKNWKPMVTPPRHTRKKIGVFATRAPYRPNQIGLSCVKFERVEGLNIYISESDILDGSPVLDVKPYLPFSDSFPDVKTGWTTTDLLQKYKVSLKPEAESEIIKIKNESGANILSYSKVQLEFNPSDISRKRITIENEDKNNLTFSLSYQKWKIFYEIDESEKTVIIKKIR